METKLSENNDLVEVIKSALPRDASPLMISVVGSRAKGMSGAKSDYDVKAIVMYPLNTYLL
jgi:hypothetical protein